MKLVKKRISSIDFMRGLLIIGMVIYHTLYNISEIFNVDINFNQPIFYYIQVLGVSLFILLCGIASNFSHNNLKRGIKLLILALIITLVTYLFNPNFYIKFGILHFLGVATIFYHFYRNFYYQNLFLLLFSAIVITILIQDIQVTNSFMFPLGLYNREFLSSDYVPIFGFIIPFIMGNIIGKYLKTKEIKKSKLANNVITFIGRHSLLIYLFHQPIILLILYLILG